MRAPAPDDPPPGAGRQRIGLRVAVLLVLSCAAYSPALIGGFTFDDAWYARARTPLGDVNPMVAELRPVGDYFTRPMGWGLDYNCRGFRPVTVLSYAAVHAVSGGAAAAGGPEPAWLQHLVNLLLHVAATWVVFRIARHFARDGPALVAAAVFGLHALHTEAIAWIVGRAELLGFVLGGTALLSYLGALCGPGPGRLPRLAAVAPLLFLAFGSKESAVAWAVFLPLVAAARGVRLRAQVPAWVVAAGLPLAAFLLLRQVVLADHVDPGGPFRVAWDANPLFDLPWFDRLPSAVMLLGYGLWQCLWPWTLSCSYGAHVFDLPAGWVDPRFAAAALVLGVGLGAGLAGRRRDPLVFVAAAAFFGFSFVTSNLAFPIETVYAERLYYTASAGVALLAAWAAARVPAAATARLAGGVLLAGWLGLSAVVSVRRSLEWGSDRTLFQADAAKHPDCIELLVDLAGVRFAELDTAGGEACLRRAVHIDPLVPRPRIELAMCLYETGARLERGRKTVAARARYREAATELEQALASPYLLPRFEGRRARALLAAVRARLGGAERPVRSRGSPRPRSTPGALRRGP